jgi:hypothetical protein
MTRFNLKGWNVGGWFLGNWSTVEEVIKVGIPYLVGCSLFASNVPMQVAITAVGKFVLDIGHYYINK